MDRRGAALAVAAIVAMASLGGYYIYGKGGTPGFAPSQTSESSETTSLSTMPATTAGHLSVTSETTSLPTGTAPGWTTYHRDNLRTGDAESVAFSSANPGWVSPNLDGSVYAEPLAFDGRVFVATENDSVYALDAQTGAVVWRTHIGAPVPGSSLPCGDISPSGITGTPVIDPATGIIYAVAFEAPSNHTLVALRVSDGGVVFEHVADPAGSDPRVEQARAALSLGNGMVYWFYGGLLGDCGEYHGWVVGLKADGTGSLVGYQVPTAREGGIWAPSGAVMDASGDLYVSTGNGASVTTFDHGDSVIKLSPSLQELGYFTPSGWAKLNQMDTDLGSVGPTGVGNGTLFQIGKEGVGYLLNMDELGGIGGQAFSAQVCTSAFGGTAYSRGVIFVPCTDGLVAVKTSGSSFIVAWRGPRLEAGPPVVTGEVVWTLDISSGVIRGFDVATGNPLYSLALGGVTRFTTPTFAYGELFVAAGDEVHSFVLGS